MASAIPRKALRDVLNRIFQKLIQTETRICCKPRFSLQTLVDISIFLYHLIFLFWRSRGCYDPSPRCVISTTTTDDDDAEVSYISWSLNGPLDPCPLLHQQPRATQETPPPHTLPDWESGEWYWSWIPESDGRASRSIKVSINSAVIHKESIKW